MKFSSWKSALASPAGRAFLALLLVLAAGAIFNADGAFFKIGTHRDTLRQASVYGMLACGMTLVIVSGGIDLAVGSLVALAAVCAAKMAIHWNWPWWEVVPATWQSERCAALWRVGDGEFARAAVYRHAFHDGPGPRPGQIRFRRHESFHRRAKSRRHLSLC
jgi:hypothetical protein